MPVLDRALQYKSSTESPLKYMAEQRKQAEDRQRQNMLADLNIRSKQRDLYDRENLTPLYEQWQSAPAGKAGQAQRAEALQGIGRIDPAKAQQMQKYELEMLQKIEDMSVARREKAEKAAAQQAAKAQWAKEGGPERWDAAGFKDKQGNPIPFADADKVIAKGKVVQGVFDFHRQAADRQTALQQDVPYIAKTLGMSEKEALLWKRNMSGKRDSEMRVSLMNALIKEGYEGDELEEKLNRLMAVARGGTAAAPEAAATPTPDNPLGL